MSVHLAFRSPHGPGRLHLDGDGPARLVLGHGAGGGVDAPDLLAARDAALSLGLSCVRVEQPWRVRGARVAEAPGRLDAAWLAALDRLDALPCVLGGRSAGARVACRTAAAVPQARAVLCLAFPLRPPGRPADRSAELALPPVPVHVVQGARDAFGVPAGAYVVAGADHAFAVRRADGRPRSEVLAEVERVVRELLAATPGLPGG